MLLDLVVPEVGESIREVQILRWNKQAGEHVEKNEELVEIETEKATVAIPAPASGRLEEVLKADSDFAEVGDIIARIAVAEDAAPAAEPKSAPPKNTAPVTPAPPTASSQPEPPKATPPKAESPKPAPPKAESLPPAPPAPLVPRRASAAKPPVAGGKLASGSTAVTTTPGTTAQRPSAASPAANVPPASSKAAAGNGSPNATTAADRREEIVPMSGLRRTVARRLVEAQRNAALLTTFNEIDMQAVMDLRKEFGEPFRRQYDVKLGFMSFFVTAVVEALRHNPALNAEVRGEQIVYRNYFDIGVAIGSERGLVVPILRDCQNLGFADIERQILDFAARASAGKISPADLTGGTFTISNGGVYGSLLSTPIVNPPQSGVLGMHSIQDRPIALNGQVVIRPMMYVALTYDHRLVDGREAVGFLRRIKDVLETPSRLLLGI
jgi:2-oxoglutarate dehydrogenase E2 component (dihydrolipoamide succinyltransferase)